jgi:lysophospholipase L1-like esterase
MSKLEVNTITAAISGQGVDFPDGLTLGGFDRPLQDIIAEVPSVTQRGAVGDGITNNLAAFTAMEQSDAPAFYVPAGIYQTGLGKLTKTYTGPGSLILSNGFGRATPSETLLSETSGLGSINSGAGIGTRVIGWIGNSIPFGFNVAESQAYPALLQKWVGRMTPAGFCSRLSGSSLDRISFSAGVTDSHTGPLGHDGGSKLMTPGSTGTFTLDQVDVIAPWFARAPGAGTLKIKKGDTVLSTTNCAGEPTLTTLGASTNVLRSGNGVTYTIECSGANVELNGLLTTRLVADAASSPVMFMSHCRSGYATSDFATLTGNELTAIKQQTLYVGYFPVFVIDLLTNDIYSDGKAMPVAQSRANLRQILTQLDLKTCAAKVVVPLRAGTGSYTENFEPFDEYRTMAFEVCREFGADVVDLSTLDLLSVGGYQADELHPNAYGHQIMADFIFQKLGLAGITCGDFVAPITLLNGAVPAIETYATAKSRLVRTNRAILEGVIVVSGVAKGTVIGTQSVATAPPKDRVINVSAVTGNATATLVLNPNGNIQLLDYTGSSIDYLSFDGITYQIDG